MQHVSQRAIGAAGVPGREFGRLDPVPRGSRIVSPDHLRILLAISSKMALSIENALKFQQVQTSATTDFLTALPNARSLFLHLDREVARCKRTAATLAVIVCDLDRFKEINDSFGHLEGNKVLRWFAQALKENCREYDYIARMGGDEFVMLAPGLAPEAAAAKAERIQEIAKWAGNKVSPRSTLSASVGIAFFPDAGLDAEQLLAEADRRMYLAKRTQAEQRKSIGWLHVVGESAERQDSSS